MNEKIKLEIQYTVEDYVRGLSFVQSRQFVMKHAYIILPCIPLAIFAFMFLMNPKLIYQMSFGLAIINFAPVLMICLLLLFLKHFPNPFLKWNLKRQIKSSPLLQAIQEVTFDAAGIEGQTNLSSAVTKWEAVTEATETDRDFFFFISNKKALFIPKRAFADDFQINLLRGLARMKLGEKARF